MLTRVLYKIKMFFCIKKAENKKKKGAFANNIDKIVLSVIVSASKNIIIKFFML